LANPRPIAGDPATRDIRKGIRMAGWDDVPVIEESDVSADELIELPANGWGQLVGWVAGVKRLRRVVDRREHMTTLYYPMKGLTIRRPRSASEQEEIEEDVNSYLAEAGVPPRPPGYVWYVGKPAAVSEGEFWVRIREAQGMSVLPGRLTSVLPGIIDALYRSGSAAS
jgi:hypothetical protein